MVVLFSSLSTLLNLYFWFFIFLNHKKCFSPYRLPSTYFYCYYSFSNIPGREYVAMHHLFSLVPSLLFFYFRFSSTQKFFFVEVLPNKVLKPHPSSSSFFSTLLISFFVSSSSSMRENYFLPSSSFYILHVILLQDLLSCWPSLSFFVSYLRPSLVGVMVPTFKEKTLPL